MWQQVMGAVVDVEFDDMESVPDILNALHVKVRCLLASGVLAVLAPSGAGAELACRLLAHDKGARVLRVLRNTVVCLLFVGPCGAWTCWSPGPIPDLCCRAPAARCVRHR